MLKKTMILGLGLGALAALPSVAMGDWTDKTENVLTQERIEFLGQFKFSGGLGSIECQMTSSTMLEPGTTGKVETFDVNGSPTEKCKTGGFLAACQVHALQAAGLPWVVHTNGQTIDMTIGSMQKSVTGGFCPVTNVLITGGTVQATPDNSHGAKSGTLSGSLAVHTSGGESFSTISGTLTVQGAASGTYGIT